MCLVVAREPDFVNTVVQSNDALAFGCLAHVRNDSLRIDRKTVVVSAFLELRFASFANFHEPREVPVALHLHLLVELPNAVSDVANHFDLRKVDRIDRSTQEVDVNDVDSPGRHEEGRFFHHIVPDVDNQIGGFNGPMHKVACRQRGITKKQRASFVDDPFAHLRSHAGDTESIDQRPQHVAGSLAIRSSSNDHQRMLGLFNALDSFPN